MTGRFPFGKFKGFAPDNVPSWYLAWALRECSALPPTLREDIQRVLDQRKSAQRQAGEDAKNRQHLRAIRQEGRK